MKNRTQTTLVNGIKSEYASIQCGVPQGSILGPLLFILFINDLPSATAFTTKLFADDTCLLFSHTNKTKLEQQINKELCEVNNWMKINKLAINCNKTYFMTFAKPNKSFDLNLHMESKSITQVSEIKYLGVILDNKLSWKPHVNFVKNKLLKCCFVLRKLKNYVAMVPLKLVY